MELLRVQQRRRIRRLFDDEVLDLDVINEAATELGLSPVIDEAPPIMVEVPPVPVPRLPCQTRNDGAGAVYLVRSANGLFKIGSARNVPHRVRMLQTGSAERLELVLTIPTKQHTHNALERRLHKRLASQRAHGEWFNLTDQDVEALRALI